MSGLKGFIDVFFGDDDCDVVFGCFLCDGDDVDGVLR